MILLSYLDLGLAAILVLALAGLSFLFKLFLAKPLLVAALRTFVQLSLVGLVLKQVFAIQDLWAVALISAAMLLVAGREVVARKKRRFVGFWS